MARKNEGTPKKAGSARNLPVRARRAANVKGGDKKQTSRTSVSELTITKISDKSSV